MKPKIVVIGSSNTDLVIQVPHFPAPGETVLGGEFMMARGGKGANQAVAAARLGADVTFISRLGQDSFGEMALAACQAEQINTDFILFDEQKASGVALIMVDQQGENEIAVASGANFALTPADVAAAESMIQSADCVLLQLEVPLSTVEAAVELANKHHVLVILNPAPARPLPTKLLHSIDILTPNETEAAILGQNINQTDAVQSVRQLGVKTIIMTLGSKGALLIRDDLQQEISTFPIEVVDSTAAGDAFNGALAVALGNGRSLQDAITFANAAGALATTKAGAQQSLPTLAEVEQILSTKT
jgi:ribokinase